MQQNHIGFNRRHWNLGSEYLKYCRSNFCLDFCFVLFDISVSALADLLHDNKMGSLRSQSNFIPFQFGPLLMQWEQARYISASSYTETVSINLGASAWYSVQGISSQMRICLWMRQWKGSSCISSFEMSITIKKEVFDNSFEEDSISFKIGVTHSGRFHAVIFSCCFINLEI